MSATTTPTVLPPLVKNGKLVLPTTPVPAVQATDAGHAPYNLAPATPATIVEDAPLSVPQSTQAAQRQHIPAQTLREMEAGRRVLHERNTYVPNYPAG